jgi:hypothetical protein
LWEVQLSDTHESKLPETPICHPEHREGYKQSLRLRLKSEHIFFATLRMTQKKKEKSLWQI